MYKKKEESRHLIGMKMKINKPICKTNNILKDNKFTLEEEAYRYEEDLEYVFYNTREVLNNLRFYTEYRVSWNDYRNKTPTLPYNCVKKRKT